MGKIVLFLLLSINMVFGFDLGSFAKSMVSTSQSNPSNRVSSLDNITVSKGLKEALKIGVKYATDMLGKNNGYLNNPLVKISLPDNLAKMEKIVRKFGGDKIADDLINSMNKAASKAAPKTIDIFMAAIDKMSLDDAKRILAGKKDAATEYFREHTSGALEKMISPIIDDTMKQNSVIQYYDAFNGYYKKYGQKYIKNSGIMSLAKNFGADSYLPGAKDEDLNKYVTDKAMDGLFKIVAQKEADIRANPLQRTTSLLKKVFN